MKALILTDIQNDFLPGGALAVPEGDAVIPAANRLQAVFSLVVATQDWHPADHGSFAANNPGTQPGQVIDLHGLPQVLWPVHCVQGTRGAEIHDELPKTMTVFRKGTDKTVDSYSGFFDNGKRKATGLGDWLRARGVDQLYILGLATDYCVKFTVLDGCQLGFDVWLIEDGCRAVNLAPGDGDRAIAAMRDAGATVIESGSITS